MSQTPYQYPSSIEVPGDPFQPIRDAKFKATSSQIEVLHVIVFLGVLAFIFGKSWKLAQALQKKSVAKTAELNSNLSRA